MCLRLKESAAGNAAIQRRCTSYSFEKNFLIKSQLPFQRHLDFIFLFLESKKRKSQKSQSTKASVAQLIYLQLPT